MHTHIHRPYSTLNTIKSGTETDWLAHALAHTMYANCIQTNKIKDPYRSILFIRYCKPISFAHYCVCVFFTLNRRPRRSYHTRRRLRLTQIYSHWFGPERLLNAFPMIVHRMLPAQCDFIALELLCVVPQRITQHQLLNASFAMCSLEAALVWARVKVYGLHHNFYKSFYTWSSGVKVS